MAQLTREAPKQVARQLVRTAFSAIPFPVALRIAALNRRLYNQLPPGHSLRFDRYHDRFSVEIDTTYPIERQMLSGEYDPETAAVIREFSRPGSCCIDVGANVGAHTLLLAKLVAPHGRVYAFEPGPPIHARLERNVQLNPEIASVIVVERLGLSDRPGVLCLNEESHNRGNAHLLDEDGVRVDVVTLDSYFAQRPVRSPISFIKIDVEGMELEVLRGARELLVRHRPAVYFETMPGSRARYMRMHGEDPFELLAHFFSELGYSLFDTAPNGSRRRVTPAKFGKNTLAIPSA
jgi:FkbM family methyltransferase